MPYPTSLDTSATLPNPSGSNTQNNPDHAGLHTAENQAIIAAETKLGTGASVPTANTLLVGTGPGTSAWSQLTSAQLAAVLSDETGNGAAVFANTPVLITPKVDTINENTSNNGVTVAGVNMKAGALTTVNSVPKGALQSNSVDYDKLAPGTIVQVVNFQTNTVATGTTLIPYDNTIPQQTEGDQYLSLAITPKSITNSLIIDIDASLYGGTGLGNVAMALFQDAAANALAAVSYGVGGATGVGTSCLLRHKMSAGTLSSTTFKMRAGLQTAGGQLTFNGIGGSAFFGGVFVSSMTIWEVKV